VLDEALKYSPFCVFLSFGDAQPFAERIRCSDAKLICQVQSLQHAQEALDAGADVIVA
jgi:nitronate monooxygenase